MLLSCSSCNSKYLLNSADLKPNGRTVRCITCGYEWYQEPNLTEDEPLEDPTSVNFKKEKDGVKSQKKITSNLPSTYLVEEKPKIFNSIMVVILLFATIFIFWFLRKEQNGTIVLINFYIQEFYFNLKLIINDIVKLIHQIIK